MRAHRGNALIKINMWGLLCMDGLRWCQVIASFRPLDLLTEILEALPHRIQKKQCLGPMSFSKIKFDHGGLPWFTALFSHLKIKC